MFAPVDVIIRYIQCPEKLFDQVVETLMLFTAILKYKVVCQSLFKQRYGNGVLSVEVLGKKKRGEGFFYALEFGIEGTIVEVDPFDDRIAFDVVVIVIKF